MAKLGQPEGSNFKLPELLSSAFEEGKFTDLDITFNGTTYKAHKVVVCTQSKVLNAMCTGGFKESQTGVINLDEDDDLDTQKLKCLLEFFYKGRYCTMKEPKVAPTPTLTQKAKITKQKKSPIAKKATDSDGKNLAPLFHAQMYALADKFDVPDLAEYARMIYKDRLETAFNANEFLESIDAVYTTTPESNKGLREAARDIAIGYLRGKFGGRTKSKTDQFFATVAAIPVFGAEVLEQLVRKDLIQKDSIRPQRQRGAGQRAFDSDSTTSNFSTLLDLFSD